MKTTTTSAATLTSQSALTSAVAGAWETVGQNFDQFCLLAGFSALGEMMEADVTALAGEAHARDTDKPGYRWGRTRRLLAAFPDAAAPSVKRAPAIPERRIDPLHILLAEDNDLNTRLATALLLKKGHLVHHVKNGQEAIEAADENGFDVILMDIHMPNLSGIDATREIRRNEAKGMRVPIIALSANLDEEPLITCVEAGMDDYLAKPLDADLLNKTLKGIPRTA